MLKRIGIICCAKMKYKKEISIFSGNDFRIDLFLSTFFSNLIVSKNVQIH